MLVLLWARVFVVGGYNVDVFGLVLNRAEARVALRRDMCRVGSKLSGLRSAMNQAAAGTPWMRCVSGRRRSYHTLWAVVNLDR